MANQPIRYEEAVAWLSKNQSHAKDLFEKYFRKRVGEQSKFVWHGQHFEWFASRVERDRFTEVDLAAIGALSVELRAQTARELIEDEDGTLNRLLSECESWISENGDDASNPDLSLEWLNKDKPFRGLWDELVKPSRVGLGDVKASKLMATKYPGLIPVYDQKVSWLLSPLDIKQWWKPMRELVIQVKPILDQFTLERDDINVTTLRKLDVVLWMEARERQRH
jgi:hypothetical protein